MRTLTQREEEIMKILWRLENAFVKEILEELPAPKPPYNTVSSVVRKLEGEGLVGFRAFGKSHQYFAILPKEEYRKTTFSNFMKDYFGGSYEQVLSFFVKEEKINEEELEDLISKIKNKSK